jgi:hypothetical protein
LMVKKKKAERRTRSRKTEIRRREKKERKKISWWERWSERKEGSVRKERRDGKKEKV